MEDEKVVIQNNVFKGVEWNGEAIEAVNNVAKALLNLTELFKSQNIQIETMLRVEHPQSTLLMSGSGISSSENNNVINQNPE